MECSAFEWVRYAARGRLTRDFAEEHVVVDGAVGVDALVGGAGEVDSLALKLLLLTY